MKLCKCFKYVEIFEKLFDKLSDMSTQFNIIIAHYIHFIILYQHKINKNNILQSEAHARLLEPPSRASMWRMGFDSPENFDDDQTYCGSVEQDTGFLCSSYSNCRGWGVQWNENSGRCGICGDPWDDFPREHEAPLGKTQSMVSLS